MQPVAVALPADVRGAPHAAVDMPAPGVFQRHPAQLREHPFEIGPGGGADVAGHAAQVGAAAAEQQAVVRGQAEVVEDELVVGHAAVARQQRLRPFLAERLSGDLIGAHRQHPLRQLAVQPVDVGVAGQHQRRAADLAVLGTDPVAVALLAIVQGPGPLVDTPAGALDGGGQAERQLERIQVCGVGIVETGKVALAGDPFGQLVLRHEA